LEAFIDADDNYLEDSLRINNYFKKFYNVYSKETKVAVDNLSLSMFKNQIFVLLGHNGAGKTTTISMLTGLIDPTEGNAQVFGLQTDSQRDLVNKITGICP
jgi:ATP-binding cassette subfamily A (ABC1) protein 3